MMYRAVMMTAMVGAALGAVIAVQNEISSQQSRQLQLAGPLTNVENNNQNPVYPGQSQQKSGLPSSQFFYPTYPEYVPDHSGYAVQTGYDGYIIPAPPPLRTASWSSSVLSTIVPLTSYALSYGARAGAYLWNLLVLLLIGGLFTTSICTFTPFCTITFLGFGINRNQVREQVSELARTYITPESMNAATLLVKKAIDKYAELQRQQREAEEKEEKKEKRRKR